MGGRVPPARDDRVLPQTRALALFIVPFLLVAFVILYVFPDDTGSLFAWTIKPTMTAMVLASAYLGGAWFFLRVLRERKCYAAGLVMPKSPGSWAVDGSVGRHSAEIHEGLTTASRAITTARRRSLLTTLSGRLGRTPVARGAARARLRTGWSPYLALQ